MSRTDRVEGGFNTILKLSLQEGITSVVGRETAKAVEFYLDPSIATKDISMYTVALEKMFSVGAKLIEERCAKALFDNLRLVFQPNAMFKLSDYVMEARKRWLLGER